MQGKSLAPPAVPPPKKGKKPPASKPPQQQKRGAGEAFTDSEASSTGGQRGRRVGLIAADSYIESDEQEDIHDSGEESEGYVPPTLSRRRSPSTSDTTGPSRPNTPLHVTQIPAELPGVAGTSTGGARKKKKQRRTSEPANVSLQIASDLSQNCNATTSSLPLSLVVGSLPIGQDRK